MEKAKPTGAEMIMDLGMGPSSYLPNFFPHQQRIIGVDILFNSVRIAKGKGLKVVQADATRLPFKSRSVDVVFSNSLIEHISESAQKDLACEILRVFKRGFFIQTPEKKFPIEPHWRIPFIQFLSHSLAKFIWRFVPKSLKWYPSQEFERISYVSSSRLKSLFPGSTLVVERFLLIPKSLIVFTSL